MDNRYQSPAVDQADDLRRLIEIQRKPSRGLAGLRSIAVVSGKGGVGKSNISVNLALALGESGMRILLLDADLGMANVDLICGITPRHTLASVISGGKTVEDILVRIDRNVTVLPGGPGVQEMADLDETGQALLIEKIGSLEGMADLLVIDTGAGIHRSVLSFALAADTTLLVTTPEPTSVRDAYGVLKALALASRSRIDVSLVVNMAKTDKEALEVAERIQLAADQFLRLPVANAGYILRDDTVLDAVRFRRPFLIGSPQGDAAKCIRRIARKFSRDGETGESVPTGRGMKAFFMRLVRGLGV
jgi:flagellar biosynthesis protein FlhG